MLIERQIIIQARKANRLSTHVITIIIFRYTFQNTGAVHHQLEASIRLAILPSLLIFSPARSILRLFGAHLRLASRSPLSAVRAKLHENVSYQSTNRSAFEGFPPWNEIWASIYHTCFKLKLMNWIIHRMKRRTAKKQNIRRIDQTVESWWRVGMGKSANNGKISEIKRFSGETNDDND